MKTNKLIFAIIATVLLFTLVHYSFARMSTGYTDLSHYLVLNFKKGIEKTTFLTRSKDNKSVRQEQKVLSDLKTNVQAAPFAPCGNITETHTVSGCFKKGASQFAIIQFEVTWTSAAESSIANDTSDLIKIQLGNRVRIIDPGPFNSLQDNKGVIRSPYMVSFQVPADGSTLTANLFRGVTLETATCSTEITGLAIPNGAGCGSGGGGGGGTAPTAVVNCMNGQLGGIVWKDTNNDGIYQSSESEAVGGVRIEAFNKMGVPVDTTISNTAGKYVLSDVDASDYPVRLQFTQLPQGTILGYQSDIRFVQNASCDINFAVYQPQANSNSGGGGSLPFATTCFVEGDRTSSKSPSDVIVASTTSLTSPTLIASKSQAGSVWGLAWNDNKKALFSSALLKRHVDLGPLGLGGIYVTNMTNPASPVTTPFIDLDNIINCGTISNFATKGGRKFKDQNPEFPATNFNNKFDPGEPSWDPEAWGKVAKAGLGDIDITDDYNTLFVVNLFERKVIKIDITAYNQSGTLPTASNVSTLPDYLPISCGGTGTTRPFGLKFYEGKLYLGLVCDGQPPSMQVQSFNFATNTWSVELPLTNIGWFRDGQATGGSPSGMYEAWSDTFDPTRLFLNFYYYHHMAILSDIEFDNKGNMILGIMDRLGHMAGGNNYRPDTTKTTFMDVYSSGDILLAHKTTNGFVLEASDIANQDRRFNFPNGRGTLTMPWPFFNDKSAVHPGSCNGGIAYQATTDSLIMSAMDPTDIYTGGLMKLNASTGKQGGKLQLYSGKRDDGYLGKGAGIGDVELLAPAPPPPPPFLQIGNYAWVDLDADGVQGPDEISLPGLDVSLYKKVGANFVFVAYTQTDASGSYTFTGKGAPNEFWVSTSGTDSLLPEMEYKIVFGYNGQASTSQVTGTNISVGGIAHSLTTPNTGEGGLPDMNDSDATFMSIAGGNYPSINLTTATEGINHSYDVGFTSSGYNGLGNFVWFDANFDGDQDPGEKGVEGVKVNLHPCVDTIPGAAITSFMRTTDKYGRYIMPGVSNGNYAISFDYSMVPGNDSLRFTIPNISANTQNLTDSDLKLPLTYLAQQPALKVAYTGCFEWNSQGGTAFDPSFDAGLIGKSELIDPTGYVYCESNGEILKGGLLTVTGPGNVYMIHNASQGYYQYYVDAVGEYTMTLTNPAGYLSSQLCLPSPVLLDAPDSVQVNNPYSIGSEDLNNDGFLDDFNCSSNRLYTKMLLEPGDFIINNNFPMACLDLGDLPGPYPTLLTNNGPRHALLQNSSLYMGQSVDAEFNGQPEAMAGIMGGGDDGESPMVDDEDGLLSPAVFIVSVPNEVRVQVNNKTNKSAKMIAFVDLNKDGDFNDAGEMKSQTVGAGFMGPVTVSFTPGINSPIGQKLGMRLRLTTDTTMTAVGFAKDGEIEDHMVSIAGFDYGDLPETYNTSGNDNPPAHVISESLKLGASVDAEADGKPDAMAGSMGAGDDGDAGLITFGTSSPAGDDENGIMLASPMVPGAVSSFMVTAMNMTSSAAVLQAWVDFNGNGSFETGEQLTTGSFAPNGATVPVGGLNGAKLTFNVPSNATFYQGNAMVRFRLSPSGGLSGNSETGTPPVGEIEDYKFPLGKVGNIVFEDRDFDGLQDAGEPGIDGVNVMVTWAGANGTIGDGDDVMYQTTTGPASSQAQGEYYVCGLIAGTYKVKFTTPANMTPTRSNIGNQTNGSTSDSDGAITGMDLTMAMETFTIANITALPTGENGLGDAAPGAVGSFPDAQTDETHDQGFAFLDYGDLPESGNGDAFNSTMAEAGAVHVIIPGLKLGASVDGERDGTGSATAVGDDNSNTGSTDDEDGISFVTPLIPGYNATVAVTAMNMTGSNAVLQGWIDWNNNGLLDGSEALAFTNNGVIPSGGVTSAPYTFAVPATAIFNDGMVFARFRLSPTGGLTADGPDKYSASTTVPQGEVEDYKLDVAKIGNYVWEDRDFDGAQESGEPSIDGVAVALVWAGADNTIGGNDDVTYATMTGPASGQQSGEYYFCGLTPGTYKLIYTSPANMTPTRSNIGSQTSGGTMDADGLVTGMDMSMAMETFTIGCAPCQPLGENGTGDNGTTPTGTFPDLHTDETHDQGFAYLDYGDLPESGNGDAFNSTMAEGGAVHVIIPGLKLGASVDGERNGTGSANADGDDNNNTGSTDDEDGIQFVTPLIPGYSATIAVTAMNMTGSNAVLQGWIDWNNNGLLDAGEALAFTNNGLIPAGGVSNAPYTFPVPAGAIFNDGMVFARFRLSPTGGLTADGPDKYNATTTVPAGEVEDYKKNLVKIGNYVWEDYDFDGQQDATEPGIGNIPVQLIWAGADGNLMTPADNVIYSTTTLNAPANGNLKGEYNFCGLIEGTYKVAITTEPGYAPTLANTGDQTNGGYTDSDGLLVPAGAFPGLGGAMVMTEPIVITLAGITQQPTNENGIGDNSPGVLGTFPNNQTNESYDFGFVAVDYGDLPNTYTTVNGTTNTGAMHIMQPGKYLGMGVDAEMDAQVDGAGTAGMWTQGDDNATSPLFFGMVTNGDDEDGVTFITPLVPGYTATARIKYTSVDVPGLPRADKTYLSAWMDMNGDGVFGAQDKIVSDLPLALGTDVVRNVTFTVPSTATFNGGAARVRFRLHCQPGLGSAGLTVGGEVEDYYIPVAKAGNYVWFDNDLRGDEMTTDAPIDFQTEAGINNAEMILIWGGLDQNLTTVADNRVYKVKTRAGNQGENQDGIYYFCGLIEGQYRIVPTKYASTLPGAGIDSLLPSDPALTVPVRKILAIANNVSGNDGKDSDGTPSLTFAVPNLLASPNATLNVLGENNLGDLPSIYNFPDRLTNMSLDFGYVQQPNIELNQKIAGVEKGGECGNFKVIVDLSIRNSGGHQNNYVMAVPLANIQAEVPLKNQLGNAFVMTMGAPQIMNGKWECGTAALPQQLPVVNAGFNGSTDTKLFNGSTGLLWPGEEVVVRYVFEVRPTNVPMPESLNLMFQASGSGKAVNYQGQPVPDYFNGGVQYMATDLSDDGLEFNGTYDDPDFKTVIGPCWNSANTLAANNSINVSIAPGECNALITDAMVLEGEPDACTDENFCLQGYFRVYILDEYNNVLPNPIDISYIGRKMKVEVENIVTCRKAWGYFNLEYKQPPVIKCTDVTVKCNEELKNIPVPTVVSCLPYTTTYTDNTIPFRCDGQYWEVVERTWTAEDSQGNSSFCVQNIGVQRQSLSGMCARIVDYDDTDKPALDCKGNWARDEKGNPSTLVTGVPDVQGCNVICTYEDKVIDVCGNSQFIERTWTCMDWCTNGTTQCVQKIRIADKFGPVLSGTGEYEYGSPDVSSCNQQIRFAKPEVDDNCSEVIRMSISVGGISGEFYYKLDGKVLSDSKYYPAVGFAKIPVGTHTILYTAEDACGNVTTATETLVVNDRVTPVAVSKQNVVVSLTGNGGGSGAAKLYVNQVDNGSYDNCGPVRLEIRRKSGGACSNVGSDGMHNNNSTFNDNNGVASENPNQTWFHNPGDNKFDTDGGEYVTFCCEDIPAGEDHGLHEVEIRVWDDANRNGIAGDNLIINGVRDNYNTTWATIRVENKLAPVLVCPADATVTCDMDIFLSLDGKVTKVKDVNLSMTGEARAYDLCSGLDVTYTDSWLGGSNPVCKTGKIRRIFTATKGSVTVTCAQIIELTGAGKAFTVTFPQRGGVSEWPSCSLSLEDVRNTANSIIKRPITDYGQCDIVGENITIDTFLFEDGACKKWRVTYKYINWCTGQEITTINGQPIVYYYTFKDEVAPVLTCTNVMVSANPNPNNANGGCEGSVVLTASATDDLVCASESWIKWQSFVDLWANGTTDRIASSFVNKAWNGIWARVDKFVAGQVNPNWSALQAQHANMVLADVVYVTYVAPSKASGGSVSLPAFTLDAENINHRVQWRVTDGCGNVDLCESTIMVSDKKAPTPYCIGISTALMQSSPKMVELWAKDFDKGSYDNCTPHAKLYYTFRDGANNTHPVLAKLNEEHFFKGAGQSASVAEYNSGKAYKWLPSARSAGKVFTAAGKFNIDILVWDEQLNADFCTVELTIISNDNTGSRIAGTVATEKGQAVTDVEVIVDANVIEYPKSSMTTNTGLYDTSHTNGVDYTVKAAKNDELLNGVSTLDIVMIQRHILGIESLTSAYQWIAADANNDGKVTAADLSALRKLVLGVSDKLPNEQQSWRFAVSGTEVSTNPVAFTERIDVENLNVDMMGQDFVAVKIGDVNGNASTHVSNPALESRSNTNIVFSVSDEAVASGEVVEIPVLASDFRDVTGCQFTMQLKGAAYIGVNAGKLTVNASNMGVISKDVITMSVANETGISAVQGDVLFTLVVKAEEATSVREMLFINSSVTPAESYTGDLTVGGVRLEDRATEVGEIELMQNEPNPFRNQTTVRFKMPKAGKATLKVVDVTGKVLAVRNIEAVRGLNTEVFTREQLGTSGVLYYTLESGDFTATRKLILVE